MSIVSTVSDLWEEARFITFLCTLFHLTHFLLSFIVMTKTCQRCGLLNCGTRGCQRCGMLNCGTQGCQKCGMLNYGTRGCQRCGMLNCGTRGLSWSFCSENFKGNPRASAADTEWQVPVIVADTEWQMPIILSCEEVLCWFSVWRFWDLRCS